MRLTTDKPTKEMSMYELAHNSCYTDKDGNTRYRDFDTDVDARVLARELLKQYADGDDAFTDDDNFDDEIMELLQYGTRTIEGLIALFYRNLWAMADLRETLKRYEDLGTVEELEQAKIKQIPNAWLNDDIEEKCICPCCHKSWSFYDNDTQTFEYCPNCGQKLT